MTKKTTKKATKKVAKKETKKTKAPKQGVGLNKLDTFRGMVLKDYSHELWVKVYNHMSRAQAFDRYIWTLDKDYFKDRMQGMKLVDPKTLSNLIEYVEKEL